MGRVSGAQLACLNPASAGVTEGSLRGPPLAAKGLLHFGELAAVDQALLRLVSFAL